MYKNNWCLFLTLFFISCNSEHPPKQWNYFNDIHNAEEMNIEYLMYEDSISRLYN